jgi:hypothetical protein
MRADNHGEGGILALMSMTGANWSQGGRVFIIMGLFGAALLYGDGIITPAISVLSALEGLNVATDVFKPHVVLDGSRNPVRLVRHPEPRHRADRQGVRAGDAAVVRGHRGVRYRRHVALSRR